MSCDATAKDRHPVCESDGCELLVPRNKGPNDWKAAHDEARRYIADLEKQCTRLRDDAILIAKDRDRLQRRCEELEEQLGGKER